MKSELSLKDAYPCPFCGSDDLKIDIGDEYCKRTPLKMVCCECEASGSHVYHPDNDISEAVRKWNQRASYNVPSPVVRITNKFEILASG